MSNVTEKPTVAFILSLVAGILILIHSLMLFVAGSIFTFVPIFGGIVLGLAVLDLICAIVVIYASTMVNTGLQSKVRLGGILVLVFSIISIIGGGGFILGFILGLVGGILALAWKPRQVQLQPTSQQ
jgi:hypothetical protein